MIDYPEDDYLEVRWYDASSAFTGHSFNEGQTLIADAVERCGRSSMLKKQALIVPAGFPPIGAPPAPEGPADFPTAYFATRAEARSWLAS